jgi:glucose/mannose-6-phosphate isomerase
MYSVDKDNFKRYLIDFPKQIAESEEIFLKNKPRLNKSLRHIVYLGMGGSAIAGDIIRDILYDDLKLPLQIIRSYEIPGHCSDKSLVIVSSYSGNTEETLSAVKAAKKKGAQIVAITSGGELLRLAKRNKWPILPVPEGFPPRQAFGYLFFLAYQLILNTINKSLSPDDFDYLIHFSEAMVQVSDELSVEGRAFTKDLALRLKNKIPIIYSSAPYLSTVATRWKNQFQENSKSMAFSNVIPEMNHNEIVGWEMESLPKKNYLVLFLEQDQTHERVKKRIQFTKSIIRDRGTEIVEIYAEGKNLLANVISLIIKGDWVSYYLALFYEKNPESIVNIDYLKSELKKES